MICGRGVHVIGVTCCLYQSSLQYQRVKSPSCPSLLIPFKVTSYFSSNLRFPLSVCHPQLAVEDKV